MGRVIEPAGDSTEKSRVQQHAHAPDALAGPWETLYADWALLPRVLELVQAQIIHAAH